MGLTTLRSGVILENSAKHRHGVSWASQPSPDSALSVLATILLRGCSGWGYRPRALQFKDNKVRVTRSGLSAQKHRGSQGGWGGVAAGDHRASQVGGRHGQDPRETAGGGEGELCWEAEDIFDPGEDKNHGCR